jgi:hypothetical protein
MEETKMLFKRKGWLRKRGDEALLQTLETVKADWLMQKELIERSIEPNEVVQCQLKLAEARYFFLIREAKERDVSMGILK